MVQVVVSQFISDINKIKSLNICGHANVSKRQIATNCFEWSTIFLFVSFKYNTKERCISPPPLKKTIIFK